MSEAWKYKIELKDASVFSRLEKQLGIPFPADLKKLIIEANGATPAKYNFMAGNDERVFGAVLSFNEDEREADSVFDAIATVNDKSLIPFGVDPFGNYICWAADSGEVVFWDHETGGLTSTGSPLNVFLNSLY